MMSSAEKQKKGLIANIRRKTSFKKGNTRQATDVTSINDSEIDSLQSSASAFDSERMAQDEEKYLALERELQAAREEIQKWEKKAAQYENVSADLDDDSFDAAQVFQLKKQLIDVREELTKHDEIKHELTDTKQELAEIRSHNEELQLQQSRKSTRTDMQRIRSEKTTREEVERLHKELRQMERNTKSQASLVEAQMKASKDSLQRAAEKAQSFQRRLDLVDKERMDLKIENQRLARKLEKSDSYAEKKRVQMEGESQQMEFANLKRKTVKLEKRLSMSTMNLSDLNELGPFNINNPSHNDSRTDSRLSSGTSSPIPMTLSEARVENLEKEVHTLEEQNTALESQNEKLKHELSAAQQKATMVHSQMEQLQASSVGVDKETEDVVLTQLPQYQNSLPQQPTQNGETHDEGLVQELQEDVAKLQKDLENKETEMRVRIKEMKATNNELKRQVEELEMEKLRLELGEEEEGEELTDTEEDGKPQDDVKQEDAPPQEESDDSEVKVLRERLMSLQDELLHISQNNQELQTRLKKQQEESDMFMKSIESELNDAMAAEEERLREQKLEESNEELKSILKEEQEANENMIKDIAQLKSIIEDQEEEIVLLKVQKDQLERQLTMRSEKSPQNKEPEVFMNGDDNIDEQPHPDSPKTEAVKDSTPTPQQELTSTPETTPTPQKEDLTPSPEKNVKSPTPTPLEKKVQSPLATPEKKMTKAPSPEKVQHLDDEIQPTPTGEDNSPPTTVTQEKIEVDTSTPSPPTHDKDKGKSGKKIGGGILSAKKSKFQTEEVDGSTPQQPKKAPPVTKKRPPRDWPPKPKKK